jgi:hypothetical protein
MNYYQSMNKKEQVAGARGSTKHADIAARRIHSNFQEHFQELTVRHFIFTQKWYRKFPPLLSS